MIDVAYLAYFNPSKDYDINVVKKFLETYSTHKAGLEHNFYLLAKNWDEENYKILKKLAQEHNAKIIDLPDDGLDLGAYFRAAKILKSEKVFFIGSGIHILCDNWLLFHEEAFKKDEKVKLAAPMGSWQKGYSGRFPNPHIRTCAFMVDRNLYNEFTSNVIFPKTKEDTWAIEHCPGNFTDFIFQKGFKAVVVNSLGKVFEKDDWYKSDTYSCVHGQEKSIMSDKWQRKFATKPLVISTKLEHDIWGKTLTKYPSNYVEKLAEDVNIFIPYKDFYTPFCSEVIHPILFGEMNVDFESCAYQDNCKENISRQYFKYGELCAHYWALKNLLPTLSAKYVGFAQLTNFSDFGIILKNKEQNHPVLDLNFNDFIEKNYTNENILKQVENYDVILPEKTPLGSFAWQQYNMIYSKADLDLFKNTINKINPKYTNAYDIFMNSTEIYPCGNMLMKKELMIDFLTWSFEFLFELEKFVNLENYLKYRDLAGSIFNVERLLNIWLIAKGDSIKIQETSTYKIYFNSDEYFSACMSQLQTLQGLQR